MKSIILLLTIPSWFTAQSQELSGISVNLFDHSATGQRTLMDGTGILFNDTWSDTVDLYDARKINNPLENIAVLRNGILLAMEKCTSNDTIPIVLWQMNSTLHEFEIIIRSVNNLFLEDMALHTITPVTNDTLRYQFTFALCDTLKRFKLLFLNVLSINTTFPAAPVADPETTVALYPNPATSGYVNICMKNAAAGSYTVSFIGYNQYRNYHLIHLTNTTERITTNLPHGNYYVVVDNEKGNRMVKQLMIQ